MYNTYSNPENFLGFLSAVAYRIQILALGYAFTVVLFCLMNY